MFHSTGRSGGRRGCDRVARMPRRAILRVAVPSPLRRHFDYLLPDHLTPPAPGTRVRVPFGKRSVVAWVVDTAADSEVPKEKLRPIADILDATPLLAADILQLLRWGADYYHHPIGEVIHTAVPVGLRQGRVAQVEGDLLYRISDSGRQVSAESLKRAPRQRELLQLLAAHGPMNAAALGERFPRWPAVMRELKKKSWVTLQRAERRKAPPAAARVPEPNLTDAQRHAVDQLGALASGFHCVLLHGVTGSGKTEVYLQTIATVLERGDQVLVLVPEIGLTPQLIERFRARFAAPMVVMHSGLSETERLDAWLAARDGRASIVIGTRSAVFVPLPRLALIVVDEEHDLSYKQQDGFRYSARDLAVVRARQRAAVVVLGSATPSLESLHNARLGRYQMISLPERATRVPMPRVHLLDLRRLAVDAGLSPPLLEAVDRCLQRGEQSLLFLNRRGYAPVLMCHACGWLAPCQRCDARLTLHRRRARLVCHHCGAESSPPSQCPACGSEVLHGIGEGTERIEDVLAKRFPHARIERIDRDSTRRKGELETKLKRAQRGEADILVGTQMLAKGHDLPNLTLVGVVNADQGLYSVDFRAAEHLFQRIAQVAGRAGRAQKTGEVLIQTHHPDHPLYAALTRHDYLGFADFALAEREQAGYPPAAYLAVLRAETPKAGEALTFLGSARELGRALGVPGVQLQDPVPSVMERRAGRYRAQLLVQAQQRAPLHQFLSAWLAELETQPAAKKVRWSLDVDPLDLT